MLGYMGLALEWEEEELLDGIDELVRRHVFVESAEGRLRFTNYLGTGDVFGEVALLTGEARTADVPTRTVRTA